MRRDIVTKRLSQESLCGFSRPPSAVTQARGFKRSFLKPAERASEYSLGWSRRRNPRSALESHRARGTGGSPLAVAHFVGFESSITTLLGLTPQALCCRLLRRLKAELGWSRCPAACLAMKCHRLPGYDVSPPNSQMSDVSEEVSGATQLSTFNFQLTSDIY